MTYLNPSSTTIGYCTNVHAGVDLASICSNLDEFAIPARDASGSDELGVGLWIPAHAAGELTNDVDSFKKFLDERRLRAFTINGFPYDNFHQPVVKRAVYLPEWWQPKRLEYTLQLADILVKLLPDGETTGSISTLPIAWSDKNATADNLAQAGANLRELATKLQSLEEKTGKRIIVAIEPEPGCVLDTTQDVVNWFEKELPETQHRRYLGVCHDICHSAVMMESQQEVLSRLVKAGVMIGKVQVSNAIIADWLSMAVGRQREAIAQLSEFAEDRYLHQTGRLKADGSFELAEDLPELLRSANSEDKPACGDRRWIVHFHVPIFLEHFGHLRTSQDDTLECLRFLNQSRAAEFTGHLEIETYAWTVLPHSMRRRGLSEDIAREIFWLRDIVADVI
ncbi:metabolite traffic protein EboE [bacterium]|nr:metabolite traffic protein EboE [bacterium]MDA7906960.1 metabolite traffic protein EboE [bacterium]